MFVEWSRSRGAKGREVGFKSSFGDGMCQGVRCERGRKRREEGGEGGSGRGRGEGRERRSSGIIVIDA